MARVAILAKPQHSLLQSIPAAFVSYPNVYRTREALLQALHAHVFEAVVISLLEETLQPTIDLILRIRRAYPQLYIVVCSDVRSDSAKGAHLIVQAIQAGANDCVLTATDAYDTVKHRLTNGLYEAYVLRHVLPCTESLVSPLIQDFLTIAIQRGRSAPTVGEISTMLGQRRQTIAQACQSAQIPTPLELVSWCRLLLAAQILDQSGMTTDHIGDRLFGSPAGFRNMLRRRVGIPSKRLKEHGAFQTVLAAFLEKLRAARAKAPGVVSSLMVWGILY